MAYIDQAKAPRKTCVHYCFIVLHFIMRHPVFRFFVLGTFYFLAIQNCPILFQSLFYFCLTRWPWWIWSSPSTLISSALSVRIWSLRSRVNTLIYYRGILSTSTTRTPTADSLKASWQRPTPGRLTRFNRDDLWFKTCTIKTVLVKRNAEITYSHCCSGN